MPKSQVKRVGLLSPENQVGTVGPLSPEEQVKRKRVGPLAVTEKSGRGHSVNGMLKRLDSLYGQ
jgi:hypothetical protein